MENTINIQSLIGTEVRSRANAEKIRLALSNNQNARIIDFNGVSFVSRSFADELCNIMDDNNTIRLMNETPFVKKMIDAVLVGRKRVRQRDDCDDKIVSFSTMDELSKYMNNM